MTVSHIGVGSLLHPQTSGTAVLGPSLEPVLGPVQTPMTLQSAFGWHGYDMHPQEFVRLSGCQECAAEKIARAESSQ